MKVLTLGGAMIDTIALIDDERIERMAMSNAQSTYLLVEQGKKIEAANVTNHCGGGAINTAVCFSRLGYDTATCVKLGNDRRADQVLNRLAEEGISSQWVLHDPIEATGASVIVSSHERDAGIFTYRGANTKLRFDEMNNEMFNVDLV